jgi:hypothetical protein
MIGATGIKVMLVTFNLLLWDSHVGIREAQRTQL